MFLFLLSFWNRFKVELTLLSISELGVEALLTIEHLLLHEISLSRSSSVLKNFTQSHVFLNIQNVVKLVAQHEIPMLVLFLRLVLDIVDEEVHLPVIDNIFLPFDVFSLLLLRLLNTYATSLTIHFSASHHCLFKGFRLMLFKSFHDLLLAQSFNWRKSPNVVIGHLTFEENGHFRFH